MRPLAKSLFLARCVLTVWLALLPANNLHASDIPIRAVTEFNNYEAYLAFLDGRDPIKVSDFSGPHTRRSVVELVLLQQALKAGGLDTPVSFFFSPNYVRMINLVQTGDFVVAGNTAWHTDTNHLKEKLHFSPPVIRRGEYEAGIYALATNRKALASVRSLKDLQNHSIVSNKHWKVDWRTLNELGMTKLYNAPVWETIVGMVIGGRVDFILSPFSTEPDLSVTYQGAKLLPVPNLKIGLLGTRHYIVSQAHPNGELVFQALKQGLSQMRQDGRIVKAFREAGFFNERVRHWQKLN